MCIRASRRHSERCQAIVHVIDCATYEPGRDPLTDLDVIEGELTAHVLRFAALTRHLVVVHDPTSAVGPRFNLVEGIANVPDARAIADVLVPTMGGDQKFWSDNAAALLAACLIRFPDLEAANGGHDSAAYQALIPLRMQAADVVLLSYDA